MLLNKLQSRSLIHPPPWLPSTTHYLCIMGSFAYGVAGDDSDSDIYGFCVPPKEMVFPHLSGEIMGFGRQIKRFEQWQQHHINDTEAGKQYDFQVYSIIKFFQLCMDNNPNMVDALFVPERCIIHCSSIGNLVRENRKLFLHRGCWHRFRGYAYSMLHKMATKTHKYLPELIAFENENNISHKTSFADVEKEMKKRGISGELHVRKPVR